MASEYAELHAHSFFSLLDGASSPEEMVAQAQANGLRALALTDHDSLAGVVRFWNAARKTGLHALLGAEVTLAAPDGQPPHHLTLLAETQQGYANLCRLISASRLDQLPAAESGTVDLDSFDPAAPVSSWPGKLAPLLTWKRLAQHAGGLIALSGCRRGPLAATLLARRPDDARAAAGRLREIFGAGNLFVELQHHACPDDDYLARKLVDLARRAGLPLVATHNAHYATREDARLRDALLAIDQNVSLSEARRLGLLPASSQMALPTLQEMAARFRHLPEALANTLLIAERCQASLDFSAHRLPAFLNSADGAGPPTPTAEFELLYQLCHEALPRRYPELRPAVLKQLAHELEVIENAGLAGYFLIVWDIVRYARERDVRCQGRGSAANSIVAYLLGITSIDPLRHNLLFERFLSADKYTTPDIDIDFAADRREEVIRYVYHRYGRAHAAMVCNVVTYRARSALRDLGKALDFPEAVIERLQGKLEHDSPRAAAEVVEAQVREMAGDPGAAPHHPLRDLADLLRRLDGCPRHLSIHSGGMLITGPPLDEIVPLEPATMPGRVVCQWDKDSCEDAGLIKIDLLALRTLGVVSEALQIADSMGEKLPEDLDALPLDDPAIYAMLQRADTVGAFQVESRAQQQMLPRLLPRRFEDIIIEVAIVRPGPIQGGAVHPYLRRRAGQEPVSYLHPSLEPVLGETLGVLLFQEQAIRVSVAAAGFNPGEADMLRRAMSRSRSVEAMQAMRARFVEGACRQGIDEATAEAIFGQLEGFAGFGFCKSHAASFALIAYQTLWLKLYNPIPFYCALFNQQPLGFYPIEVLAGDARRHGVDLLPPDVNASVWLYAPERTPGGAWGLRMGLSAVRALGAAGWESIEQARGAGPFADLADFVRRTRLDRDVVTNLIRAGACDSLGRQREGANTRRDLLWQLGETDDRPDEMPLLLEPSEAGLPPLPPLEQTGWEYELLGLSPDGQVMRHYRAQLRARRIAGTWEVKRMEAGRVVRVAGMMAVRQRPQTAKGIVFISLEDESGLLDLVVKPEVYARLRDVLRGSLLLVVEGEVQRSGTGVRPVGQSVSVLVYDAMPLEEIA